MPEQTVAPLEVKNEQLALVEVRRSEICTNWPGFRNSRTHLGDYTELKASIASTGLLTPPIVWLVNEDGKETYVLVAGYRRMQCLKELADEVDKNLYKNVTCMLYEGDLNGALGLNLVENVERADLNAADAADAVVFMYERLGRQELVTQVFSRSQGWVSNYYRLGMGLCRRGKEALRQELLSLKKAKTLATLTLSDGKPDEVKQHELLDKWLNNEDTEAKKQSKRERTTRSKTEMEALRTRLQRIGPEGCEETHKQSLLTLLQWYFHEIDGDDVLVRQEGEEVEEEVPTDVTPVVTKSRRDAVVQETDEKPQARRLGARS